MSIYTIQNVLGPSPHQFSDGTAGSVYMVQLVEHPTPLKMFRRLNDAPTPGPVDGSIDRDAFRITRRAERQQPTPPQPSATQPQPAQQASVDWAEKDRRIGRQAAVKAAVWAYPLVYGQPEFGRTVTPPMVAEFFERLRPLIDWFEADSAAKHEPVQAEPPQANTTNDSDIPF